MVAEHHEHLRRKARGDGGMSPRGGSPQSEQRAEGELPPSSWGEEEGARAALKIVDEHHEHLRRKARRNGGMLSESESEMLVLEGQKNGRKPTGAAIAKERKSSRSPTPIGDREELRTGEQETKENMINDLRQGHQHRWNGINKKNPTPKVARGRGVHHDVHHKALAVDRGPPLAGKGVPSVGAHDKLPQEVVPPQTDRLGGQEGQLRARDRRRGPRMSGVHHDVHHGATLQKPRGIDVHHGLAGRRPSSSPPRSPLQKNGPRSPKESSRSPGGITSCFRHNTSVSVVSVRVLSCKGSE